MTNLLQTNLFPETEDLVTFTEEILKWKTSFLCSVSCSATDAHGNSSLDLDLSSLHLSSYEISI